MPEDVPGAGGTEIGWRLARRAWHRGYATEAALAARDVAFTGAGLAELWSMTAVLNTPSQAVMRRIGMTEAARFEHPRVPIGSPVKPHVVYHLAGPGAAELVELDLPCQVRGGLSSRPRSSVRCAAGRAPHNGHESAAFPAKKTQVSGVAGPGGVGLGPFDDGGPGQS
jgi:hypothetical protein